MEVAIRVLSECRVRVRVMVSVGLQLGWCLNAATLGSWVKATPRAKEQ